MNAAEREDVDFMAKLSKGQIQRCRKHNARVDDDHLNVSG